MPRLSRADKAVIRRALLIAIDTQESLADAHRPFHGAEPTAHNLDIIAMCDRDISHFRRLLETNFGGPEAGLILDPVPLSELIKRPPGSKFEPPKKR